MAKAKPSWTDKLNGGRTPEVRLLDKDGPSMRAGQRMLISSPAAIDAAIRAVPAGKTLDVAELRRGLAEAARADVTCPLTTGIFLRIVAEAANEAFDRGTPPNKLTPVWRVIDRKAPLVKKLSFDPEWLFDLRDRECR